MPVKVQYSFTSYRTSTPSLALIWATFAGSGWMNVEPVPLAFSASAVSIFLAFDRAIFSEIELLPDFMMSPPLTLLPQSNIHIKRGSDTHSWYEVPAGWRCYD